MKETYATMNQKIPVRMARKGTKNGRLEELSSWSVATAPKRKPGVSSSRTALTAPARGGIGGFGDEVFKVGQSRCRCAPLQKRHGDIFELYGFEFFTRGAVSVFVVIAATVAASLDTTCLRSSSEDA
jgi:hypothetical protein